MIRNFHSHGKLLLTGEYAILDGAMGLALPTCVGQSMMTEPSEKGVLLWESRDHKGKAWLKTSFDLKTLTPIDKPHEELHMLQVLLAAVKRLSPGFLTEDQGYKVVTTLEFPRFWGLGSSSTLVNNMAEWGSVDPYRLQMETFGGSGYDIACARLGHPLLYQLSEGKPTVVPTPFYPAFHEFLYFVYLNKKQNSREAIQAYKKRQSDVPRLVARLSDITQAVAVVNTLDEFEALLTEHESVVSEILGIPTVKDRQFPDFPGVIKSLGAWGGDFILATGGPELVSFFNNRGYQTVLPYEQIVARPLGNR